MAAVHKHGSLGERSGSCGECHVRIRRVTVAQPSSRDVARRVGLAASGLLVFARVSRDESVA